MTVLSAERPLPSKTASTVCVPAASAEVVNVQVAVVPVVPPATPATGVPSITKLTVPVGVEAAETVAVNVTAPP